MFMLLYLPSLSLLQRKIRESRIFVALGLKEGYFNFPLHALKSTIGAGGLLGGVQI